MRLLTVGSIPPEWGGSTLGGVGTLHQSLHEEFSGHPARYPELESVHLLPANLSAAGPKIPENLLIADTTLVPPQGDSDLRDWYKATIRAVRPDVVLFLHLIGRHQRLHYRTAARVPCVGSVQSWHSDCNVEELAYARSTVMDRTWHSREMADAVRNHLSTESLARGYLEALHAAVEM